MNCSGPPHPPDSRRLLIATRLIAKNRRETEPQAGANRALDTGVWPAKLRFRLSLQAAVCRSDGSGNQFSSVRQMAPF